MRFPYVIENNTKDTYTPSKAAISLISEGNRKIFAENLSWGDDDFPTLVTLCVQNISKNFETYPKIDEVYGAERDFLLEILSTDLPLEIVIPLIDEEIYWKRRFSDKFGPIKERLYPGWTWKSIFLERYVRDSVEKAQPQYNDEQEMIAILKLCSPYVRKLQITELQAWKPPRAWQGGEIPEIYPIKHINFVPILSNLINVNQLDIVFGMNNVYEVFDWNMFDVSVEDCKLLGQAILTLKNLTILRLHRSKVKDFHTQALMQGIIKNSSLIELDLSNCFIGDHGALCIAKVMTVHPSLKILNLCNNNIKKIGAEGIGFALLTDTCCPLVSLNLKLNPLEHDGVMGILRSIIRGTKPKELNISCCFFEEDTPLRLAQTLRINASLEFLDVSNNWFGAEGGKILLELIKDNTALKTMELKETDIPEQYLHEIEKILKRNRVGEEVEDSLESEEEEISIQDEEVMNHSVPETTLVTDGEQE